MAEQICHMCGSTTHVLPHMGGVIQVHRLPLYYFS